MTHNKPLVSVLLFTFNQEDFIRDAVNSILGQSYTPIEIILSDDCSKDNTFEIIREMANAYKGPHQVKVNRNEKNLGIGGHVSKLISMSEGKIIVLAAGDDISFADRVFASWELLSKNEDCTSVSFKTIPFTDNSKIKKTVVKDEYHLSKYTIENQIRNAGFHVPGAARAFRREVFDKYGPLNKGVPTEDSTMLLRCLLSGPVLKSANPKVYRRKHGGNAWGSDSRHRLDYSKIHRQYLTDLKRGLKIGDITKIQHQGLIDIFELRLRRRFDEGLDNSEHKINYYIQNILFSPSLRLRKKLGYVKRAILGFLSR